MASHGEGHVPGYTPARTNEGWGAALFICALTAALALTAFVIHSKTYTNPVDPRSPDRGRPEAVHEAPAHDAPAAHGAAPAAPAPQH